MSTILKGTGISGELAIGSLRVEKQGTSVSEQKISASDIEEHEKRFHAASDQADVELTKLYDEMMEEGRSQEAEIIEVQQEFLQDPAIVDAILGRINKDLNNVELAVYQGLEENIAVFEQMDDAYFQQRSLDLKDLRSRLLRILSGEAEQVYGDKEVIVACNELYPAMVLGAKKKRIVGFIVEQGAMTSHASILAKALDLPLLIHVEGAVEAFEVGDTLVLDIAKQEVYGELSSDELAGYREKLEEVEQEKIRLQKYRQMEARSKDGVRVELAANIVSVEEVEAVLENKADGIGLFRTEFLYMQSSKLPSEEEQFAAYRQVVERMAPHPVIIRTLDIGGDKHADCLNLQTEDNPFMGYRAIRICLNEKALFMTQIRAILRASHYGKARLMIPMVVAREEIEQTRELVEQAKEQLRSVGFPFDEELEIGIMAETPASVVCLPDWLDIVDFVSIGTNDLTQYMLAVDRTNPQLQSYYNYGNKAVLRAIKMICDAGAEQDTWVGVCGEMASEKDWVPFLVGCGVKELSVGAGRINMVKEILQKYTIAECKDIVRQHLGDR
ncbi:phosphoenolpyruvate--protein phosphotransferase [Clostridia bacterium]|nr:phosphoenolpyruvate--protein phosphotransferase [Clostridia bacterium]